MQPSPLSLANIEAARTVIDPVFLDTPQFESEPLSVWVGAKVAFKVECLNPIRSFKGRGACYFTHVHKDTAPRPRKPWICASAGNFGQGLAYAVRPHDIPLVVFAAKTANPLKVERMRALGAEVRLVGDDFDAAKEQARRHAEEQGCTFVEDGRDPAVSEGAGTIAVEILSRPERFDAVLVPLGNGALINGIGTWMKAHSPETEILGVGATRAPAMERSFREGRPIALDDSAETIADGVATRVSIPEAVATMIEVVDDVLLVEEEDIVEAMRAIFREIGLVVEGAGAVTLGAARTFRERFRGARLLLLVGGGNADEKIVGRYLCGGNHG